MAFIIISYPAKYRPFRTERSTDNTAMVYCNANDMRITITQTQPITVDYNPVRTRYHVLLIKHKA